MTGRKGRVVRRPKGRTGSELVYEARAKPDSQDMDSLNGQCARARVCVRARARARVCVCVCVRSPVCRVELLKLDLQAVDVRHCTLYVCCSKDLCVCSLAA